jgi:hypothetical protein
VDGNSMALLGASRIKVLSMISTKENIVEKQLHASL